MSDYSINVHGALMSVAWCAVIPLGVLAARNKWLFRDNKFFELHWWFHAHRSLQLIGSALFLSSFVLAMTALGVPDGDAGYAHYCMGITIMTAVAAQLIFVLFRPPKNHDARLIWNALHHNLGRITLLLAFVNVYLGIYCMQSQTGYPYYVLAWIVPVTVCIFIFLESLVVLEIINVRRSNTET
jgi:hypothetical protein